MTSTAILNSTLCTVPRRYRLPALADMSFDMEKTSPSTVLAIVIERARQAVADGKEPDAVLKNLFTTALARLIRGAMGSDHPDAAKERAAGGDPAFQAMVLRHRVPQVDEHASLSKHINQDRRIIHSAVNAIAHPGKQHKTPPGWQRDAMKELHAAVFASFPSSISTPARPSTTDTDSVSDSETQPESSASWSTLTAIARRLLTMPQIVHESPFERALIQLLDSSELERLQRFEALASNKSVRQYQMRCDRQGPPSGSDTAVAQGSASRQRGAAVEALAAQALRALARRLNQADGREERPKERGGAPYRVVTSMHVSDSIPGQAKYAKTEWDVVLLRQANTTDSTPAWDVCLLVEAKASVDAATTDFPKLLAGLRLLAHAEENVVYLFETQEGMVRVRGASLRKLSNDEAALKKTVLYCCDSSTKASADMSVHTLFDADSETRSDMSSNWSMGVPANPPVRLLNAANRMRLLSVPACVEFASKLGQRQHADPSSLAPVWHELLELPRLSAVLHQYPTLRQVRELMVHPDDLLSAINDIAGP